MGQHISSFLSSRVSGLQLCRCFRIRELAEEHEKPAEEYVEDQSLGKEWSRKRTGTLPERRNIPMIGVRGAIPTNLLRLAIHETSYHSGP